MRRRSVFGGVADLEAHSQVVGAVVEQQDGEDAVIDDRAHQLRGALEQCLQVERGVQRVRQPDEKLGGQRFDANLVCADAGVLGR